MSIERLQSMRTFHISRDGLSDRQCESLSLAIIMQGATQGIQAFVTYSDEGNLLVHLSTPEEERALAYEAAVRCSVMALRNL
jgi:hypothetical protein